MTPTRAGGLALSAAVALAATAPQLRASPIDVTFDPPEITASDVCVARSPVHELAARWEDWDGTTLPDRSIPLIRRDLRLLVQADAERWADTVARANDLLLREVDSYDDTDRMLDRIDLLVALNDIDTLREEGLAERLVEIAPGASTSAQMTAAKLLREGTGIAADAGKANELIRSAAYAGHADAIMQLAGRTAAGEDVPDWTIDPEVAVTLAFGALLGDVDPRVCDRINQIAGYYEDGEVVAQNVPLAEEWYRLSARLGGSNGAWNVAQLHQNARHLERDTDVMLAHLKQAAEADLTYAQLKLGRIYERGSLAPRDLGKAESLYREAADFGDPAALTRLVNLERDTSGDTSEERQEIIALLERMTKLPEPPAWAFSRLGNMLLAEEGRWAGEDRARELFRSALDHDPYQVPARSRLARIEMRYVDTEQDFADVTSRLRRVVAANGRAGPMQDLQAAYQCRGPSAPNPEKHQYWLDMENFSGDTTVDLSATELRRQARQTDPTVLAQLQTQALNSRATSLATLLEVSARPGELAPLRDVVEATGAKTNIALSKVALKLGDTARAKDALREAVAAGETGAAMDLVRLLRKGGVSDAEREEILSLVRPLAGQGQGAAIRTIIDLDEGTDAAAAWDRYQGAIERNGDFEALVFALTHLGDAGRVDDYIGRIRAVMSCHSANALALAEAMDELGRKDAAQHWLTIAEATARTGWEYVAAGDVVQDLALSEDADATAEALFRRGVDEGYALAMRRLLNMAKADTIELAEAESVDLYSRMIQNSPPRNVPSVLEMVSFAPDAVRQKVEARIDRRDLYRRAAAQGNPTAQIELAKIIQAEADSADDLGRYAELIKGAAEQGNDEAMLRLSKAYTYGFGVARSAEKSDAWLLRAAEAGNEEAQNTARMLQTAQEPTQ